eukprot:SAG11_NODE_449_length_9392_cov_16.435381_7_plen_121_part_00
METRREGSGSNGMRPPANLDEQHLWRWGYLGARLFHMFCRRSVEQPLVFGQNVGELVAALPHEFAERLAHLGHLLLKFHGDSRGALSTRDGAFEEAHTVRVVARRLIEQRRVYDSFIVQG